MKQLFLMMSLILLCLTGCDTEVNETNATIKAKDFIERDLLFPDDAEISNGRGEKTSENYYHVVYDVKAKNIMGAMVPLKASVRLSYKGEGEWTDEANWRCSSIEYLNEATGETDVEVKKSYAELQKKLKAAVAANEAKTKVATTEPADNSIKLGGIKFEVIESSGTAMRVYSKKKIQDLSDINRIYKDMGKQGIDQVQLCDKPNAARGQEYAAIQGNLYLDHERDIIKTLK